MGELLSEVSDLIWTTWHIRIDPAEMEMSWTNLDGWSCRLRNPSSLHHVPSVHRHGWVRQQDRGPSMDALVFTAFDQPYIMGLICHRAIPCAARQNVLNRCVCGTESVF